MNLPKLQLLMLAVVFAWAQVCCCQAWAVLDLAAGAANSGSAVEGSSCCGGCIVPNGAGVAGNPAEPEAPCHDEGDCADCLPRLGWVPEGPTEIALDPLGVAAPAVHFADPPALMTQWRPDARGRDEFFEPPTLVRMHCALIV